MCLDGQPRKWTDTSFLKLLQCLGALRAQPCGGVIEGFREFFLGLFGRQGFGLYNSIYITMLVGCSGDVLTAPTTAGYGAWHKGFWGC